MSKGMWAKQFTIDGKVFYYNATLSKSAWRPPLDAVVHEAENLKPPEKESASDIERRKNLEAVLQFTSETFSLQNDEISQISEIQNQEEAVPILDPYISHLMMPFVPFPSPFEATPGINIMFAPHITDTREEFNTRSGDDIQQRLAQVAASKQKQIRSKRFRSQENKDEGDESQYQKLVSHYQAMSGSNADDSSKWLVR